VSVSARPANLQAVDHAPVAKRRVFQTLLLLSIIFPNLRLLGNANAFQPLTLPLIAAHCAISGRIDTYALRFAAVFLTVSILLLSVHQDFSGRSMLFMVLYLSGPLTFYYFLRFSGQDGWRFFEKTLNIGIGFAFVSVAEEFFIDSAIIEKAQSLIFTRPYDFDTGLMREGGRGVAGFMQEPSHTGRLYVCLLYMLVICRCRGASLWLWLTLPFLLMNRSASTFMLALPLVFALLYRRSKVLLVAAAALSVVVLPLFLGLEYRFVDSVERLMLGMQELSSGEGATVSVMGLMGGRRLIQTVIGYHSMFEFPMGHGVASSLDSFYQAAAAMGYDLTQWFWYRDVAQGVKPSSYMSQISYDYGVFAIPLIFAFFSFSGKFKLSRDPIRRVCFAMGVFQILLASTTTIPWPWVMMALGFVETSSMEQTAGGRRRHALSNSRRT
jgi:hypothetical protein